MKCITILIFYKNLISSVIRNAHSDKLTCYKLFSEYFKHLGGNRNSAFRESTEIGSKVLKANSESPFKVSEPYDNPFWEKR